MFVRGYRFLMVTYMCAMGYRFLWSLICQCYNTVIGIVMDIHASNLCVRCNTDTTKLSETLVQSQSTRQHTCTSNK